LSEIDIVEAADVDGDHLCPVGSAPLGKGADPACVAEQMVDDLFVELVVGQIALT
jgi:hypothetical protein